MADRLSTNAAVEIPSDAVDWHLLHHTQVELIDPAAVAVIARHAMEGRVVSVLTGGRAAVVVFSADDVPMVQIMRPSLAIER